MKIDLCKIGKQPFLRLDTPILHALHLIFTTRNLVIDYTGAALSIFSLWFFFKTRGSHGFPPPPLFELSINFYYRTSELSILLSSSETSRRSLHLTIEQNTFTTIKSSEAFFSVKPFYRLLVNW